MNEQPLEYWRQLFASHGFRAFDCIRPLINSVGSVEPWHKYNTLLYVHESALPSLPPTITATMLKENDRVLDLSPLSYRLRCAIMRALPAFAVTAIARAKHKIMRAAWRTSRSSS